MKAVVIRGNLKEGISLVERAAGENLNLPILRNVRISALEGRLSLTATNLELAVTCVIPGKVIADGSLTVPLSALGSLIANLPTERINLEAKNNNLHLATDSYEGTVVGLPAEDYPVIPKLEESNGSLKIEGGLFKSSLEQVSAAAQTSDLRPELSSVLFDFSLDHLKLVATDTFRLAEKTITKGKFTTTFKEPFRVLVPIRTVQEIIRAVREDEMLDIQFDRSQILIKTDRFEMISRLIEGVFPDYKHILPKDFTLQTTLSRGEFLSALKLMGVLGSRTNEIKLGLAKNHKGLEISAKDQGVGEGSYILPAKIQGTAGVVTFNWKYLSDGLRVLGVDDVFLGLNEEKPAILKDIKDSSFFYILAPLLGSN